MHAATRPPSIVLFDGECGLCHRTVLFAARRDPPPHALRFAPLQSPVGRALLTRHGLNSDQLDSLVLIENSRVFTRTSATLRILRRLRFPWPLLSGLIIIPPPIRNLLYRLIARYRLRVFGRADACALPAELAGRMLDDSTETRGDFRVQPARPPIH